MSNTKSNQNKALRKEMLRHIGPGIIGLLFNSLYIVVDGIFVAKMLGEQALAAVTTVVPVVEILIALSLMISIGGGIYISLYKGKGDAKTARNYYNHGLLLALSTSLLLTLLALLFRTPFVSLLGATPLILSQAVEYFTWFMIFVPFFVLNYALGTWVRNDGKPKLAMAGQIIGALLNIVLDYVFMGPLQMGIKGAAIATGLGPVLGILLVLPHFLGKKGDLYYEKTKWQSLYFRNILIGGLPSFFIEFSLGLTTFFCNLFLVARFQEQGLAAFGVVGYLNLILLSLFLGMGQGTQPLVSRLHGKGEEEGIRQIYHTSLRLSIILGIGAYLLLRIAKPLLIPIFIDPTNQSLYQLTATAIDLFFITLAISGINVVTASLFEAKQAVPQSTLISFCRSLFFLIPSLWILQQFPNPMVLWLGVPLAEIATLFVSCFLWKQQPPEKISLPASL